MTQDQDVSVPRRTIQQLLGALNAAQREVAAAEAHERRVATTLDRPAPAWRVEQLQELSEELEDLVVAMEDAMTASMQQEHVEALLRAGQGRTGDFPF